MLMKFKEMFQKEVNEELQTEKKNIIDKLEGYHRELLQKLKG